MNLFESIDFRFLSLIKLSPKLKVKPEDRGVSEETGRTKSRARSDAAALVYELIYPLVRNPNTPGKFFLG